MSSSETGASSEYLEYYELFNTSDNSFPAMNPPSQNSVPQYKFHNPTGSPSKINPNPVPTIVITTETQTTFFETGYLLCFRCRNNLVPPTDPVSGTHGPRPQSGIGNNRRASMPAKMQENSRNKKGKLFKADTSPGPGTYGAPQQRHGSKPRKSLPGSLYD